MLARDASGKKKNHLVKAPMFCLSISEAGRKTIIIKKKKAETMVARKRK